MATATAEPGALPARWYPLRYHAEQDRLKRSRARFKVVEAGRRSGKTELAKRDGVEAWTHAALETGLTDYFVGFFAPTRDQAKRIYWEDLKALVPPFCVSRVYETDLVIRHVAGPMLAVVGMDKPMRAEGAPVDRAYLDELADMKQGTWARNIRPALDTPGRPGSAWLYGVPRPSPQFAELSEIARNDTTGEWDYFWWDSASILTEDQIRAAKRDLDQRTFDQEYCAKRVQPSGLAYYAFDESVHAVDGLPYDADAPLVFCFDYNVSPGTAVVVQELSHPELGQVTACIGEVFIPDDSNTPLVCERLLRDWGQHRGEVYYYGDPTGGNRGTAKLAGNDWELVYGALRTPFSGRLFDRVARKSKSERLRVNALNARLRNAAGEVHLLVDKAKCPRLLRDFRNVLLLEGSAGELDKRTTGRDSVTHWTDAVGYYCLERHPIVEHMLTIESI